MGEVMVEHHGQCEEHGEVVAIIEHETGPYPRQVPCPECGKAFAPEAHVVQGG